MLDGKAARLVSPRVNPFVNLLRWWGRAHAFMYLLFFHMHLLSHEHVRAAVSQPPPPRCRLMRRCMRQRRHAAWRPLPPWHLKEDGQRSHCDTNTRGSRCMRRGTPPHHARRRVSPSVGLAPRYSRCPCSPRPASHTITQRHNAPTQQHNTGAAKPECLRMWFTEAGGAQRALREPRTNTTPNTNTHPTGSSSSSNQSRFFFPPPFPRFVKDADDNWRQHSRSQAKPSRENLGCCVQ